MSTTTRSTLQGDIYGGLTAAVVALPLGIAFGVSSGAGAITGLYSAIIVGFFASLFGGTKTQVSGPTGPMTVVMAGVISHYINVDPNTGPAIAFTVVMLAGLFQIAFGVLKFGRYIIMVPYTVVSAFMSGIGIIIIVLQLGPLMGGDAGANVTAALLDLPHTWQQGSVPALILGAAGLLLLFCWPSRWQRLLPAPLACLIIATIASLIIPALPEIPRVGEIPSGLPQLHIPTWSPELIQNMLVSALLLAALGSIDSLLTSLVADNMTGSYHNADRELIGQGIGNTFAGLFGALPGAGATMRTVVNINAGGRNKWSGMFHSMVLLAAVLGAGSLAEKIPQTVLAAILIKVGIDIVDWRYLKRSWHFPFESNLLLYAVLLMTVFVDLITAVLVGVFIANMLTIKKLAKFQLNEVQLKTMSIAELYDSECQVEHNSADGKPVLLMDINGPLSYAIGREFRQRFAASGQHDALVIDLSKAQIVGLSTATILIDLIEFEQGDGKSVLLVAPNDVAKSKLERLGLWQFIVPQQLVESRDQAASYLLSIQQSPMRSSCSTNH
ncbi:sodium-independent anion transporter [Neiella marina]|uniref:Sodium-independent anion transporter n=1 Tax=Neiella marina TaxID=508461 RepID=A0A8J2U5B0_9GAMM|nr:SulP family inorganic anion transporter [Neiella marina]GGA77723.1 sodium-independent anion transporter [Neiella marina]